MAEQRSVFKKSIDRADRYITSDASNEAGMEDLQVRLERLLSAFKSFEEEHLQIVADIPANDAEAVALNEQVFEETEELYLSVKAKFIRRINQIGGDEFERNLRRRVDDYENPIADDVENVQSGVRDDNVSQVAQAPFKAPEQIQVTIDNNPMMGYHQSRLATELHLAPQSLPSFNGDFTQWITFRDTYIRFVHNDGNLFPISKFNALANHLIGDAAQVIAGIPRTDDNYDMAWQLVMDEYNKPRLIHDALMAMISSLKPMPTENLPSLKYIVSKFKQVTRQLESMGTDINACGQMLAYQLCRLLDPVTRRDWELQHHTNDALPLSALFEFLDRRVSGLSMVARSQSGRLSTQSSNNRPSTSSGVINRPSTSTATVNRPQVKSAIVKPPESTKNASNSCALCKEAHGIENCPKFLGMNPFKRFQKVRGLKLCFGCLSSAHDITKCPQPICTLCTANKKHHRLLCFVNCDRERAAQESNTVPSYHVTVSQEGGVQMNEMESANVVLGTAFIKIKDVNGEFQLARALCDTGSQTNVISESCVKRLGLTRRSTQTSIVPVGDDNEIGVRGIVSILITSRKNTQEFQFNTNALIMGRVATFLPAVPFAGGIWPDQIGNNLADPTYTEPGQIDILLGAGVWSAILRSSIRKNEQTNLTAQLTQFGWVIFGGVANDNRHFVGLARTNGPSNAELNDSLKKFWELDDIKERQYRSDEEQRCENLFVRHYKRTQKGRYVVPIPLMENAPALGDSKMRAIRQFYAIESRFSREPEFRRDYVAFMEKFIIRGIMKEYPAIDESQPHYYVPHHGIKSNRKKFRVVFNGSARTTNGISFNEIQLVGERLQPKLADIVLRFRLNRITLTGDIEQMYPQVLVRDSDHQLQLILWRDAPHKPLKTYALTTVTFGMSYVPHSAIRAMQQCALDGANNYPLASAVAIRDFYVDDLISGANSENEAIRLYREMNQLMESGGFPLKKWSSNSWPVMSAIHRKNDIPNYSVEFKEDEIQSVLGTHWNPATDEFQFSVDEPMWTEANTKRLITSEVLKVFDPIGMLSPIVVKGKMFIRDLWLAKNDWDDIVPTAVSDRFIEFRRNLKDVEQFRIKRWIGISNNETIELHGFCDASMNAYAAAVYFKAVNANGTVTTGLLTSKTKVAPIKTISIPRLELSGALLLAELMRVVRLAYNGRNMVEHYWTDSEVVLGWLNKSPHELKVFVQNRVAEIQRLTSIPKWNHVPTDSNPADIASRGSLASELVNNELWWFGPHWLKSNETEWPAMPLQFSNDSMQAIACEEKPKQAATLIVHQPWIMNKYSSYSKLIVITALIKRFIHKMRHKAALRKSGTVIMRKKRLAKRFNFERLSRDELEEAEKFWFKTVQKIAFGELKPNQPVPRRSKLVQMNPFVDTNGLVRVGGRLQAANITYDQKHPIILPGDSILTHMLIRMYHLTFLHGGVQIVTRQLREKFWIVGGRNAIRKVIYNCVTCTRHRKEMCVQQMAPLVPSRVNIGERAFTNVSVDYAGPFGLKQHSGRCKTAIFAYVAVFICMATRAIHLELVMDASAEAFMDAFHRFAARRGQPKLIISDNAKCFVGAKRKLHAVIEEWNKCAHLTSFVRLGIDWKFIMPRSPSQGGSHEAAVKLFKHHLKRVVGAQRPTITTFSSLIIRIEGCINSRPLSPMYDDPKDDLVLTPAHFLFSNTADAVPIDSPVVENQTLVSKWRHIQFLHQQLWKKFKSDYINHLQHRSKWQERQRMVKVGDIVLLREDSPPAVWPMGIVSEVHPGSDGVVRNVTIRYGSKTFKRSVQQLCLLVEDETEVSCRRDVTAQGCNK